MKKFLTTIVALLLVACTLFATACGGGGNTNLDYDKAIEKFTSLGQFEVERSDVEEFLTLAEQNENPTYPNINDGITICFFEETNQNYGGGTMTMQKFIMNVKTIDGVLLAEGTFKMNVIFLGQEQVATVKFYYDGTYFGMEITQEGYEPDKQKSEISLWTALNNFVGEENYFENGLAVIPTSVAEIKEHVVGTYQGNWDELQFFMKEYNDGITAVDYLKTVLFDENYNILGCQYFGNLNQIKVFNGDIKMPSDFDSWTIR